MSSQRVATVAASGFPPERKTRSLPDNGKTGFTSVTLRPKVAFADPAHAAKLAEFHERAHRNCFMSNSVNFPVTVEPDLG